MKKIISVLLTFFLSLICFSACSIENDNDNDNDDTHNIVTLTTDNYNYYLNLDPISTGSGSALGGSLRWTSYKMTITGAVNALYVDCVLYYKTQEEQQEKSINLNASGFATFTYTLTLGDSFNVVRVEGEIHL